MKAWLFLLGVICASLISTALTNKIKPHGHGKKDKSKNH
jgi:hypothetical protein